jgi:thiamine kinase-like enzyme
MVKMIEIISSFLKFLDRPSMSISDVKYEPLKGGGSQATLYRLEWGGQFYVLRLFPSKTPPDTRMHQIMLAKQAGKIGGGPKIHFVDDPVTGMIMEFIPGRTVQKADFDSFSALANFAYFLRGIHQSNEHFPLAASPFKRFHDFYSKLEQQNRDLPPQFPHIKSLMEELEMLFHLIPIPLVPCHLDLHPLNIMLSETQFSLVDWVNGGLSDPYFDLATFSIFHELDEAKTKIFFEHYLGRSATLLELDRLIITQPIRLFVIAAALFSSDAVCSYKTLMQNPLPLLEDFTKHGAIWPHPVLGMSMLQKGLSLIGHNRFQSSLKNLKMHATSLKEIKLNE